MVTGRVKELPVISLASASWAAVEKHHRQTVLAATVLDVNRMPAADIHQLDRERLNGWVQSSHR